MDFEPKSGGGLIEALWHATCPFGVIDFPNQFYWFLERRSRSCDTFLLRTSNSKPYSKPRLLVDQGARNVREGLLSSLDSIFGEVSPKGG